MNHFFDAWNEPATRHAMIVHFPVVLSIVGIPFAVVAALMRHRDRAIRWAALALYLALAASGLVARNSGHHAQDAISGSLDDDAQAVLDVHDSLGHKVWLIGAGICVLLGVSFVPNAKLRLPSAWLAVAGSLFAAGWVANTADHGGRLVYEHGAGTPDRVAELLAAPDASAEPAEDPRVTFFRRQVRPILATHCLRCHNPRRVRRSGGLDQTTIAGLLEGGWSGPALTPGKPAESLLITAVRREDPDLQMPLGADPLPEELIAALERWIAEGAVWEPFEYVPPAE
ncbi:MAG: c-type cytochrome domain-containing protein [Planctomycetota bacterium]|jgi:uncharacterized membrane protein